MSGALVPKGAYYSAGPTLVDMGLIANGGGHSWTTGATATIGGQAGALRLRAQWNFIDGVQGPGSGVMLPNLTGGQLVYISNRSASSITVWTAINTADAIVGVGASETLPAGTTRTYVSVADGWIEWIATGGSSSGPFLPTAGGTIQPPAPLTGNSATSLTITDTAAGSGVNGPATAQFGMAINHNKVNWDANPQSGVGVGEIDGLIITCRQGGAGSDCGGFLVNVQNTGLGFLAMCEMAASVQDVTTHAITKYINVQIGALDGPTNKAYGMNITATTGNLDFGLQILDTPGQATWANAFNVTQGGASVFTIAGNGSVTTSAPILINNAAHGYLTVQGTPSGVIATGASLMWNHSGGDGGTWLINQKGGGSGGFHFSEADSSGVLTDRLNIDGSGNINAIGSVTTVGGYHTNTGYYLRSDSAIGIQLDTGTNGIQFWLGGNAAEILGSGGLTIFGTKVVGTQVAGWGTPTGGSRTANFNGASATLAQTSATLAQLILDLKAHGLLGA